MASLDVCAKKTEAGNMPCGRPVIYLDADAAKAQNRGPYSGLYHQEPADHHAVPKKWLS
jgi:hypothetical protein